MSNGQWTGTGDPDVYGSDGYKYQCVEYVRRFYRIAMGVDTTVSAWRGNGVDYYGTATSRGLVAYANGGTEAPQPGDIMCYSGHTYGHVAIVKGISSNSVDFIEQNVHRETCFRTSTLSNSNGRFTVSTLGTGYTVQGWLRKPGSNQPPRAILENWPTDGRWYRTNEHIPWRITSGTNPIHIDEIINGTWVGGYDRNVGDTGYVNLQALGTGWKQCWVRVTNPYGTFDSVERWNGGYDDTLPTVSQTAGPSPRTWIQSAGQAVQYTGSDVGAGFKDSHWWYEGRGDSGWSGENPRGSPLPNTDGKYRLHVEVADDSWTGNDHFGNSSGDVVLGEYWVDNTAPSVRIVSVTPPSPGDASQVSIVVDGDDPGYPDTGSGLASGVVTVDGVVIPDVGGSHLWDASNAADGPHTIVATVTDGAGNTASATTTYTIDRTPPTATLTVGPAAPNGLNDWYITAPTVTLAAVGGTGTPSLRYRINGGAETTYTAPFTFTQRGAVTIEYWAVSSSGKKGTVGTATVKVDTTKPSGFTLEDEGAKTPSVSALNVTLRGVIDGESGYLGFQYKVGNAAGDDRYWTNGSMPARGPWLTMDGLFLPPNVPVVVTLRVQNGAGVWSDWFATDGITVDPAAWEHAVWNMVVGAAGGPSTAADGAHDGTLGEPIVGQSVTNDGLLDGGFWSLFAAPQLGVSLALGDYKASTSTSPVPPVSVTIELRLPGTTTVVERHEVMASSTGSYSIALGRVGTFDVAIKANHWLRVVRKNVFVSSLGVRLGTITLLNGDVNGDNRVNNLDASLLRAALNSRSGSANWNPLADLNGDGRVNNLDNSILINNLNRRGDN